MAENGVFRNAFRGFNKQDVLEYIDRMQGEASASLKSAERRAKEAGELVASLQEENRQLQAKVQEESAGKEEQLSTLQEENAKLTALAQAYKRELVQLRDRLAASELRAADSDALQKQVTLLSKQNEQYARVVGDVSRVMMQARVVSASYFDNAHKSSIECLEQLQSFLDDMKVQAAEAVRTADTHHEESGDTIDSLLEQLQSAELPENE